jgi:hypothetical protein
MELIKASLMAAAMQGGGGGSSQDWQDLLSMMHDLFTIPINSKYHFVYQVAMGKDLRFFGTWYDRGSAQFFTRPVYIGDGESTNTQVGVELVQYPKEVDMYSGVFEFITLYENDEPILTWWTNGREFNGDKVTTYSYYFSNYEDNSYWVEGQRVTEAEYKAAYYSTTPHSTSRAAAYKSEEYSNYAWLGGSGGFSRFYWYGSTYQSTGIYPSAYASWSYGYTYDYITRSANIDYNDPTTGCGTTPESITVTASTTTRSKSVNRSNESFSLIPTKSYDYLIYTNKTFAELNAAYDEIIAEIARASVAQMSNQNLYGGIAPYLS